MWITNKVTKTAKDKLNKWKKYKGEKTTETYRQYKKAQNLASKTVRAAKHRIEKNIASNIKSDPKAFYKYIKQKTKNKQEITALKTDKGTLTSTDEEIAELLNEYFSTVFTNELTNVIPSTELTQIQEPMTLNPNASNKDQIENLL